MQAVLTFISDRQKHIAFILCVLNVEEVNSLENVTHVYSGVFAQFDL